MAVAYLRANCVEFPGRAGEFQRAGATAGLIRELGDNYSRYHEYLQGRLEEMGGDPDPKEFADDPTEYGRRSDTVQRIVASEILLRRARAQRQQGRELSDPLLDHPPVWDAEHRLVDTEHPERSTFRRPQAFGPLVFGPLGTATVPPRYPELP